MLSVCRWMLAIVVMALGTDSLKAGVLAEDFSTNPGAKGWQVFGNTNLFSWDGNQGLLNVTWDSSSSNSYFYHALGNVLARDDDFSLEFDLRLLDIRTTTKSGPFEIAVGLINLADATRSDFWRGSGVNAVHGPRNLVEFDYFPAGYYAGFGDVAASVSPTLVSSNNVFAAGFDLLELTNNLLFHITLLYTASNATLRTTLTCDGAPFGQIKDVVANAAFGDFRVSAVAICSYSDIGDDYDSVLAHGQIDNLVVRTPPPPVSLAEGVLTNRIWQVAFTGQTNWTYTLQRTTDLQSWTPVSDPLSGSQGTLVLEDAGPPAGAAFYRVAAQRP